MTRFACILTLSAYAAAAQVDFDKMPPVDLANATTGYTYLPAGGATKTSSYALQTVVVQAGVGGVMTIAQTVIPSEVVEDSVVQSWIGLIGVGDYNDNMYAIANGTPGPNLKQEDLKQTVACGRPRSMALPGYKTAAESDLSEYYCSLEVVNTMSFAQGPFVQTMSLALYETQTAGALLQGISVNATLGYNWYKHAGPASKIIDSWSSDQFPIVLDGALTATLGITTAVLAAVHF